MSSLGESMNTGTLARVIVPILGSTLLLTSSFLGILAIITGKVPGFSTRFPWYVLLMALGFVAALFLLERPNLEGTQILVATLGLTVTIFVVVTLAGEGVTYAMRYPDEVFVSNLILYLVAAGLIGSGLAFWSIRHWREYTNYVR
ncbi:MAG: hypothetical protein ABEJ67_02265 [Halanaeroarchaeum sp.]